MYGINKNKNKIMYRAQTGLKAVADKSLDELIQNRLTSNEKFYDCSRHYLSWEFCTEVQVIISFR